MSRKLDSMAWLRSLGACASLSANERLTGAMLHTWRSTKSPTCYPTLRQIADRCGTGTRTASRGLAGLQREGFVTIVAHGHKGRATVYRMLESDAEREERRKAMALNEPSKTCEHTPTGLQLSSQDGTNRVVDGSSSNLTDKSRVSVTAKASHQVTKEKTDTEEGVSLRFQRLAVLKRAGLPATEDTVDDWNAIIVEAKVNGRITSEDCITLLVHHRARSVPHARGIMAGYWKSLA